MFPQSIPITSKTTKETSVVIKVPAIFAGTSDIDTYGTSRTNSNIE